MQFPVTIPRKYLARQINCVRVPDCIKRENRLSLGLDRTSCPTIQTVGGDGWTPMIGKASEMV